MLAPKLLQFSPQLVITDTVTSFLIVDVDVLFMEFVHDPSQNCDMVPVPHA